MALTESPIEQIMLDEFKRQPHRFLIPPLGRGVSIDVADRVGQMHPNFIVVVPQVSVGRYRVDFLVLDNAFGRRRLAVECDGRQFHGSEAAQDRDASRDDRNLHWHKLPTIRLSGSEIVSDVAGCVARCLNEIVSLPAVTA